MISPPDVLIVGAGPAGCVAATVLARAGVRVRLVDRSDFPRPKLCGDTLNPGSLGLLRRLGLAAEAEAIGMAVHGMLVTGEGGVAVAGRYPRGLHGRSLSRSDLDWALLQEAIRAGAGFEPGVAVRSAVVDDGRVTGVTVGSNGTARRLSATVTIAADGRHSTLAFGLGLARHPPQPRRWAVGAYFENLHGTGAAGEMHIRRGRYIGISPLPHGLTNVCVVVPAGAGRAAGAPERGLRDPRRMLAEALASDPVLRERAAEARQVTDAAVLGPLAVDVPYPAAIPEGLLLAGDAGGFVDPMTGDGLRFAIRGGELAGLAALRVLEQGWAGVQPELMSTRQREFAGKWRFNRALRSLVASPSLVRAAATGARFAPAVVRRIIAHAGDCHLA
jgi:flavin-dependent dehydrogenase